MKNNVFTPFLALVGIILLVTLACSITSAPFVPPSQPTQPILPTETLSPTKAPTETPLPTKAPTATPAPTEPPVYFTEEFNGDIPDWWSFVQHGDKNKANISTDNSRLIFELNGTDVYAYLMYDPWIYKNVRLDVSAENRGKNTNSISLICRYSKNEGWYEFNIGNDGLWQIYVYDILTKGGYKLLGSGGSTAIHTGKAINEYTAVCDGTTLSLYINGVKTTSFEEKIYALREGLVGIGVSSYDVLPIIVEFDWVSISKP